MLNLLDLNLYSLSNRLCSRSPEKTVSSRWNSDSPRWKDERQSSPKRVSGRGSPPPRWNDERGLAPQRDENRPSPLRRSDKRPERTDERRALCRTSEERGRVKKTSPGDRNEDRLTSHMKTDERRLSPRRVVERRLSPRRVVERRLSPRTIDTRLSTEALSLLEASGFSFYNIQNCN